jgi:hypothetical protein
MAEMLCDKGRIGRKQVFQVSPQRDRQPVLFEGGVR